MSRGSGSTREMRTWQETVSKEDKCVRAARRPNALPTSTRPSNTPLLVRFPVILFFSRLTTSSPRRCRITKKSEKYFFDRDRVRWVEWEKEGEAFAEVAGEEAANPAKTKQNFPTTKSRIFSVVD